MIWQPIKGPVIFELGRGALVVFRDGGLEAFGKAQPYPNGYRLCRQVPDAASVPNASVLNTIKVLAYEMSKTMIGMADRFPEGDVRANVAKLDEVLAWVESIEQKEASDVE